MKHPVKRSHAILLAVSSTMALAGPIALAWAETPKDLVAAYSLEAARAQPGFSASAERGRTFFLKKWAVTDKMPNCAACHTERPAQPGSHVITAKPIRPLAPAVNAERFTRGDKVEKWFRRNCSEVVGRECTAAEKADFVQFLASAGGA